MPRAHNGGMKRSALLPPLAFLARQFLSGIAPPRCRGCRAPLFDHGNPFLCRECVDRMSWIGAGACPRCGYPAGPHADHKRGCRRCRGRHALLDGTAAVARYRGGARSLVKSLKFRGETELAEPMAGLMAERFAAASIGPVDVIVPVVLHVSRRRERGFDQSLLLGRGLSRRLGVPLGPNLLERRRDTRPQARLRRDERLRNMEGAFRADAGVSGRRLLLVDDVTTTGATLRECARICREAGAKKVWALVFAR